MQVYIIPFISMHLVCKSDGFFFYGWLEICKITNEMTRGASPKLPGTSWNSSPVAFGCLRGGLAGGDVGGEPGAPGLGVQGPGAARRPRGGGC